MDDDALLAGLTFALARHGFPVIPAMFVAFGLVLVGYAAFSVFDAGRRAWKAICG